jgi:hypothetical protein
MPRRNSRGRFVKSGGSSHRTTRRRRRSSHRSQSVALVRSSPRPIVIRESSRAVTHRRRARHHGGGGGGILGGASRAGLKVKAEVAGWASVLGYLETSKADTFDKIPTFGKLPREAVVGLALHLIGKKNKHLERASVAALAVAGYKLGANGYSLSGFDE